LVGGGGVLACQIGSIFLLSMRLQDREKGGGGGKEKTRGSKNLWLIKGKPDSAVEGCRRGLRRERRAKNEDICHRRLCPIGKWGKSSVNVDPSKKRSGCCISP